MAEQKTKTHTPHISHKGKELAFKDVPLTVKSTEPYKCKHCSEDFTLDQIKAVVSSVDESVTKRVLQFLNTYRKDENFKLDTCLRKAHFIAQVAAETRFSKMKEDHDFNYDALPVHKFGLNQPIDETMLQSLEDHLEDIFKITDSKGKIIAKTKSQLKTILSTKKPSVDVGKLYGRYKQGDEVLKTITKKEINKDGNEVDVVDYNIVLKNHESFAIPLLSRRYANHPRSKNGNELSRDGYKFCGKGIKQITHRYNYQKFTDRRKALGFPDYDKHLDFTLTTNKTTIEGNYDKLADKSNVMYGVQAAIWYWLEGNGSVYKGSDNDNVAEVSYRINGGWYGFNKGVNARKKTIIRARKAFKVYEHYKLVYENGKHSDKTKVKENLSKIGSGYSSRGKTVEKDPKAEELLKEIKESEVLKPIETRPFIPLVVKKDLTLAPMNFETPTNTESNKKKRKQR